MHRTVTRWVQPLRSYSAGAEGPAMPDASARSSARRRRLSVRDSGGGTRHCNALVDLVVRGVTKGWLVIWNDKNQSGSEWFMRLITFDHIWSPWSTVPRIFCVFLLVSGFLTCDSFVWRYSNGSPQRHDWSLGIELGYSGDIMRLYT